MSYPTGILINTAAGTFHPISFREAPMPGGVQPPGGRRYKSIGHHTEGFATKAEAEAWIAANPDRVRATGRTWEWDGKGVPAMVEFFAADESGAPPEAEGIKAIIALQKLAGIEETEQAARKGWQGLSDHDKRQTMLAFAACCPQEPR